ncbi:hypothetical protein F4559_005212 [Saccharothrix violaceirubra]|uniref:DUF5753 domain-containing protein n=2 Tax=Saccharothrix violaceirubra TaxID=413306 RepID=A0A7W7T772_9PSEU|nr:hypothetical protein [Saccharothrix violaceirubra]
MTIEQVVERLRDGQGKWSRSKLGRIETREQGVKRHEVEELLDLYGVYDPTIRPWLLGLVSTVNERGYWLALRKDLPSDFHEFLGVEAALVRLREFETMVVPGLLQVPEYTRALIYGANPGLERDLAEGRVQARMARQQVLNRTVPLRLHVILDEAILERPVGSAAVMRDQLQRLIDTGAENHVTVQILQKSAGASPALDGPFSLLTLPAPIPDFGYAEGQGGAVYIEDVDHVRECAQRWGILTGKALSAVDSLDVLREAVNTYDEQT